MKFSALFSSSTRPAELTRPFFRAISCTSDVIIDVIFPDIANIFQIRSTLASKGLSGGFE